MAFKIKGYGWKPDYPDHRDFQFAPAPAVARPRPAQIDLRKNMPEVYDQGQLGSCTANGIAACCEYDEIIEQAKSEFTPSRLFIYYNERRIEGTINEDSGAQIRDGMKTLNTWGYAPETMWPYDINKFADQPPKSVYEAARPNIVRQYSSVGQSRDRICDTLAGGLPIVFGFTVYDSFESPTVAATGFVPLPLHGDQPIGGHCVVLCGYDDAQKLYLVRNSWGAGWGQKGYCQFPYAYVEDPGLSSDFWIVKRVPVA